MRAQSAGKHRQLARNGQAEITLKLRHEVGALKIKGPVPALCAAPECPVAVLLCLHGFPQGANSPAFLPNQWMRAHCQLRSADSTSCI